MSTAPSARVASRGRLRAWAVPLVLSPRLVVLAAGALTGVLTLLWLGRPSLWFDETVSVQAARLPATDLARYVATVEVNMSLYTSLLHAWLWLGDGDAFARSFSVVFGLGTLPLVYALGRRLFDGRTAVAAVVVLAANVQFVGHAREARSYALAMFLVSASTLFLVRAVQEDRRRDWILFAVAGALAVYAHLLAAFALAALLLSLVLLRRRIDFRDAASSAVLCAVLLVPLAVSLLAHWQGAQIDWVATPALRQLPGLFLWFAGSRAALALFAAGALLALTTGVREWRHGRDPERAWPYLLLLALVVVPALLAFVISFAKPIYLYRYFLVSLPALALLVAAGLVRLPRLWLVVPAVVAVAGLSTATTASCLPGCVIGGDDWRTATAYVQENTQPGDEILFVPGQLRTPFAHYSRAGPRPRLLYPARWPLVGGRAEGERTLAEALGRATAAGRVWLVTWWLPQEGVAERLARALGPPVTREFGENVRVRLYRAGAP
jgi:mannosyltransferase